MTQYRKVFDETVYNKLDEDDNLKLKSRRELLDIDVDKVETLKNAQMFVGSEVSKEIKALGLHPDSTQKRWLYDDVKKFHLEACKKLQKYFRTVLSSTVMDNMSALDPKLQSHFATKEKLKSLASQYSKIVDSIQFVDGKDMIRKEIEKYVTDKDVMEINKDEGLERFWTNVKNVTDGSEEWPRYQVLPRFVLCMATKYDSNSEVERTFSFMNLIHQNKQRNRMSQDTLNAHLHIASGIESAQNKSNCEKCDKKNISPHCHCTLFEVSDSLREKCRVAHRICVRWTMLLLKKSLRRKALKRRRRLWRMKREESRN